MCKTCFIYAYWTKTERNVSSDEDNPVVLSIETLRRCNPKASIYVFDYSEGRSSWPAHDGYAVIKTEPKFREKPGLCWGTFSKIFDITEFATTLPEEHIVICDTDVFWLRPFDPLKFDQFKLNCYDNNTGVLYYNKASKPAAIEEWKSVMQEAWQDNLARKRALAVYAKKTGHVKDVLTEERSLTSVNDDLISDPGIELNGILRRLKPRHLNTIFNLHIMRSYIPPGLRGILAKSISELNLPCNKKIPLSRVVQMPRSKILKFAHSVKESRDVAWL